MTSGRPWVALFVLLAAGTIWWTWRGDDATPRPQPPATAPARVESDGPVTPAPAAPVARSGDDVAALPAETPPATVIALLAPRADAGDAHAACRVAITLLDCREAALFVQADWASPEERGAESVLTPQQEASERHAEDLQLRVAELHAACAAIPQEIRDRASDYLTQAAHAGEPEAMLRYVDGHHLPTRTGMDFLAHPGFDAWRRDAPAMLQRLFVAGEPEAVFLLWVGRSQNLGLLSGILPDDPQAALAYRFLMTRLSRGTDPEPLPDVGAAEIQRAREQAIAWHRQYFGGRVYGDTATLRRLTGRVLNPDGDSRVPCAR